MTADPPMVKQDGGYICAVCSKPLNELTVKNNDPFDSGSCASAWYGLEHASTTTALGNDGRRKKGT